MPNRGMYSLTCVFFNYIPQLKSSTVFAFCRMTFRISIFTKRAGLAAVSFIYPFSKEIYVGMFDVMKMKFIYLLKAGERPITETIFPVVP